MQPKDWILTMHSVLFLRAAVPVKWYTAALASNSAPLRGEYTAIHRPYRRHGFELHSEAFVYLKSQVVTGNHSLLGGQ